MGLDQYMFKRIKDNVDEGVTIEIAYWRKVRHIHNWMEQKWRANGNDGEFNWDEELTMTHELLDELEKDTATGNLQDYDADGFFFGYYDFTKEEEEYLLSVISECRKAIDEGYYVYYNSSW
jgi:hypothetical protein